MCTQLHIFVNGRHTYWQFVWTVGGQHHAPAALPTGKTRWAPGPVWTCGKNLAPTGIRSPERPGHSQSLYRLSYPAHSHFKVRWQNCEKLLLVRQICLFNLSSCSLVHPHETTRFPHVFEYFSKIYREISNVIKIWQELRVLKWKPIHIFGHISCSFLEWEMLHARIEEKIKTPILCPIYFLQKSCRVWDNVENFLQPDRPQTAIWRMRIACWITKSTDYTQNIILIECPLQ
jgi:hypothetical protein